jgi:signal transduction histidine kinase
MSRPTATLDHPRLLPAMLVPQDADPDSRRLRRTTRDWIVDVACFTVAVLVGLGLFAIEEARDEVSDTVLSIDFAVGVAACLAIWLRRRWPLGLALALVPAGAVSASAGGAAAIALFTLAVHRRFAVVAPVAVLGVAVSPIFIALHPDDSTPPGVEFLFGMLGTVAIVAWGMFVRARRQLVLSLRERALRAEAEQQLRVDQARAAERARIAREMHDVLAHRISLLSLHAGALEFRRDATPEEVARAAGVMRATAHQALQDLREVIGVLREGPDGDAPERPQPTLADLPALIEESRAAGMAVSSDFAVDDAVPDGVARSAYRIVQEGLTNARKHARGAAVTVTVAGAPGSGLTVEVRNRLPLGRAAAEGRAGRPADEIPGAGTGIVGLAERVDLAGGRLEHGRTDDGDFRLWAWLPWPE